MLNSACPPAAARTSALKTFEMSNAHSALLLISFLCSVQFQLFQNTVATENNKHEGQHWAGLETLLNHSQIYGQILGNFVYILNTGQLFHAFSHSLAVLVLQYNNCTILYL